MPKTRTNKYIQKSKRSRRRNTKLTKRVRKVSNNSTARNKFHKLQYGGAEHINKPSNEMLERAKERREALLAKEQQPPVVATTTLSQISKLQPLRTALAELVMKQIIKSQ